MSESSSGQLLPLIAVDQVAAKRRDPVDAATLAEAGRIVEDVRSRGEAALREYGERLDGLKPDASLILSRDEMQRITADVNPEHRRLLERIADRIGFFAEAQLESLMPLDIAIEGGRAGHAVIPVDHAGCYVPGGRFPLPSSALMTVVTARVAGVPNVTVATPNPQPITIAAATIAGADRVLTVGGAHAIAALAYGAGANITPCDVIVGPGNRWVTAAKKLVAGHVGIDMLAGPSELLIIADHSADPAIVAADLIAQAEHDPDALPMLISLESYLVERVRDEMERQVADLPDGRVAVESLRNGFAVVVENEDDAVRLSDRIAPEHLEIMTVDADDLAGRVRNYGGLFVHPGSAEVFGDYGAGPNHVLPTSGAARHTGGLSVLNFLTIRTWLRIDPIGKAKMALIDDTMALARLEGLEAHARAADRRR